MSELYPDLSSYLRSSALLYPQSEPFAPCFKCSARTSFPHSDTLSFQSTSTVFLMVANACCNFSARLALFSTSCLNCSSVSKCSFVHFLFCSVKFHFLFQFQVLIITLFSFSVNSFCFIFTTPQKKPLDFSWGLSVSLVYTTLTFLPPEMLFIACTTNISG